MLETSRWELCISYRCIWWCYIWSSCVNPVIDLCIYNTDLISSSSTILELSEVASLENNFWRLRYLKCSGLHSLQFWILYNEYAISWVTVEASNTVPQNLNDARAAILEEWDTFMTYHWSVNFSINFPYILLKSKRFQCFLNRLFFYLLLFSILMVGNWKDQ